MKMRKILHISDLHFCELEGKKSLLQNDKYFADFINSIKGFENLDTLVISGDIVDCGGNQRVFECAGDFIKKIKEETGIKNILSVPGNHDVSRTRLKTYSERKDVNTQKLWENYDEKLGYYWEFIEANKINFCHNSGMVSYLILNDPNVILLGLDSTDRIGIEDQCGYVNVKELEKSIKNLFDQKGKFEEYIKIAVLHHRPLIYESGSQTITENNSNQIGVYGTCNSANWKEVKQTLQKYGIQYIWTGHVHGSQSGHIWSGEKTEGGITYSTVGSIGVDFSIELRENLDAEKAKQFMSRLDDLQCYVSLYGNHNSYNVWTITDTGLVREEQYKYIVDEGERCWYKWSGKDFGEEQQGTTEGDVFGTQVDCVDEQSEESEPPENYGEKILECVREHGLYKTGHYHWKNSARLNWIDTSYFFQNREMMYCIARGINKLFEEKELKDVDCVIGLGIKGALLLSYIRFLFQEKQCTYFPENRKEYNEYEMALFGNEKKYTNIAVITDVVHSGNTIKEFAKVIYDTYNKDKSNNKDKLNIKVVTIFDSTQDHKIAELRGKAKFKLFSLAKLKVTKCPGGGENCDIYLNKLADVIEYKEDENESN
ncbi:MAG: metallophosphoesterase [Lachnospiraceae bacterium]|nr:metallophosphoesterase [Lachnospiraceae bacterium]